MQPWGLLGEDLGKVRAEDRRRKERASWHDLDRPRFRVALGRRLVVAGARLMGAPADAILSKLEA